METEPYLQRLTTRLADGLARAPQAVRARHAAYLHTAQNPDGGFSGREGGSDLYYSGFALRALAALDALTPEVSRRAAGFLRHSLSQQAAVVDFFSLLYACMLVQASGGSDVLADSPPDWPDRVADTLERFRTPDGGYGKAPGASGGSTYHTFLVGLCYQLLGRPLPGADDVARFIAGRRREDGGYVEIAPMRRSGTNPTAAAVGVLTLLEDADVGQGSNLPPSPGRLATCPTDVRDGVLSFLAAMPSSEGGLRANGRAPLADLLSTFTGTWTLHELAGLDHIDTSAALRYARALEQPAGGFRGGLWDDRTDPEYTFYGLGCLALLTP
jgi:geranylgeranyl transferase type-2 subunit beta